MAPHHYKPCPNGTRSVKPIARANLILMAAALLSFACAPLRAADASDAAHAANRPAAVFNHGVAVFEQQRELAPRASLRFRVLHGGGGALTLWLKSPAGQMPLPLTPDSTFNPTALSDGQSIVAAPDNHAGPLAWRPDIRSPGLPPHSRRLGDLRLECLVDQQSGLNPQEPRANCLPPARQADCLEQMGDCLRGASLALLAQWHAMHRLQWARATGQPQPARYLFIAKHPLAAIQLAHGEHRLTLPAGWLHGGGAQNGASWPYPREYLYSLPLDAVEWPDDTLVTFGDAAKS